MEGRERSGRAIAALAAGGRTGSLATGSSEGLLDRVGRGDAQEEEPRAGLEPRRATRAFKMVTGPVKRG